MVRLVVATFPLLFIIGCGKTDSGKSNANPPEASSAPTAAVAVTASNAAKSAAPPPKLPVPKLAPFSTGVIINITITQPENGRPIITGETNLPDQTKLAIVWENDFWKDCAPEDPCPKGKTWADDLIVLGGRFNTQAWRSDALPSGKYKATVVMPIASAQPKEVQAVIGTKGERLKGKLVKKLQDDPRVEVEQIFNVP